MAQTNNYNKKCPKCDGKWVLGIIRGERTGWFFRKPDKIIVCNNCKYGTIEPKKVIHHVDRFEPTIIY